MAEILVRNLDKVVVDRLKAKAKLKGRSLQTEVKTILEDAANAPLSDITDARKLILKIRRQFKGREFPDSITLIREDRDR